MGKQSVFELCLHRVCVHTYLSPSCTEDDSTQEEFSGSERKGHSFLEELAHLPL